MIRSILITLVVLVSSLALPVSPVAAQRASLDEARQFYQLGVVAYQRQEWASCADYFERSFIHAFAPELLFNIGRCYGNAGSETGNADQLRRAVAAYTRYLRELPTTSDRDEVQAEIARLRERLDSLEGESPTYEVEAEPTTPTVEEPVVETAPDVPVLTITETSLSTDPQPQGPNYLLTVSGGVTAGATFVAAIVLGVVGMNQYNTLMAQCAPDCSDAAVQELSTIQDSANVLFTVTGGVALGTGVAFGLEVSGAF